MKYPFIETPKTVQYDVLHAIESGSGTNSIILAQLCQRGRTVTAKQIQMATLRLYQGGRIQRANGLWVLSTANKWLRIKKAREGAEAVRPNGIFAFYREAGTQAWVELTPPFSSESAKPGINRLLCNCTDSEGHKYTLALLYFGEVTEQDFAATRLLAELVIAEFGVEFLFIESLKVPQ